MKNLKRVVLNCLLCMTVLSLTACSEKETGPQVIQESPTPTPMAEANFSTETEESITNIQENKLQKNLLYKDNTEI